MGPESLTFFRNWLKNKQNRYFTYFTGENESFGFQGIIDID